MKKLVSHFAIFFTFFASIIASSKASSYNFGSVEIKPFANKNQQEWFIEYLKPGQTIEKQIKISNFDTSAKKIELYTSDNLNGEEPTFFTQSAEEIKKAEADIGEWVSLGTSELILKPKESRVLNINFRIPQKAGIGLHSGAIIAREITTDNNGNEIKLEKGVRIYLNVLGPAITSYEKKETLDESHQQFNYKTTIINKGNTDLDTTYGLALENIWGEAVPQSTASTKVKPGQSFIGNISLQKPTLGIYHLFVLRNNEKELVKTEIIMPFWLEALMFIGVFLMIKVLKKIKKELKKISFPLIPKYKKSFAYWSIFLVMTLSFFSFQGSGSTVVKAELSTPKSVSSYKITIRLGNVRGFILPPKLTQEWNGKLSVKEGTMSIEELKDFEKSDMAEVVDNGQAVEWKNTTGPDNDGISLRINSSMDMIPTLTYRDLMNGEEFSFTVNDVANQPLLIPNGLFSLEIKSEPIVEEIKPLQESSASADIQEANKEKNAPELQNLFIEDLPPTADALQKFILDSDYVKNVNTDQKTSKVEADSILIKALQERSDVLNQVAGNDPVNYIFIPTDTINFPPQEFSFNKSSSSTQELGSMIFVQNKQTPWNTYISTTNFTSLSGKGKIPASSLTIIPGKTHILNKDSHANIQEGGNKNFSNSSDKSLLVNVNPGSGTDEIFVLNPKLQVRIPAGTLPGKYRGSLTITSL